MLKRCPHGLGAQIVLTCKVKFSFAWPDLQGAITCRISVRKTLLQVIAPCQKNLQSGHVRLDVTSDSDYITE